MLRFPASANPDQKLDNILKHLHEYENPRDGTKGGHGGTVVHLNMCYSSYDPVVFGLKNKKEMLFYLDQLIEQKMISVKGSTYETMTDGFSNNVSFPATISLTFKGLAHVADIINKPEISNRCFVAMVFDDDREKRLKAIQEACDKYGFIAQDVTGFQTNNNQTIDANIISAIKGSRFMIADFTKCNPGAYMEGGYAMGRNMKVIFACNAKDFEENKKHFDVSHYPFILYNDFAELTSKLSASIDAYVNI